jgi:hypothetical protein
MDELLIPLKRSRRIRGVLGPLVLLLLGPVGVAVGLPVAHLRNPQPPAFTGLMIGFAVVVGLIVVTIGGLLGWTVYQRVRIARSPGIMLDGNGFEFMGRTGRWADVEDVTDVISQLPVKPSDFDTGGQPLDDVLRNWLQRYRDD